jgi:hypothetical protein
MNELIIMSQDELYSMDGGVSIDAILGGVIFLSVTVGLAAVAMSPAAPIAVVAASAYLGSVTWTAGVSATIYGIVA